MARVPASKETRKRLQQLFEGRGAAEADRGELVKLAARLIVEEALEGEVEDVLGREYYAHGGAARGHRNGYRGGKLDTAEGRLKRAAAGVAAPAPQPFPLPKARRKVGGPR